jgi:monoamine oxidase
MSDYSIIGAGIAGLNLAVKLKRKYPDKVVVIFEKENRLGGRIYTHPSKIECGAARFSNTHKRVNTLVKDYQLSSKLIKLPKKINYIETKRYNTDFINANDIITELIKYKEKYSKDFLMNVTFKEFASIVFSEETSRLLENGYPYYSEISIVNAYDAIKSFEEDLSHTKTFYTLKGGLSQIIEKLEKEFISLGGMIKKNHSLIEIKTDETGVSLIFNKSNTIKSEILILAIPVNGLKGVKGVKGVNGMNSVQGKPLLRVYYTYDSKDSWFTDIPKTTTDDKIKYIIPINKNVIMINYSDGPKATYWNNAYKDGTQDKKIAESLKRLFPDRNIPKYKKKHHFFWEFGAAYWKKGSDSKKVHDQMLNPSPNLYICGDSFSNHQAWVEGALQTSDEVFDLLRMNQKN